MNFRYVFDHVLPHVCEPILMQRVAFDREWTGYSHVCHFENSKIIGGYRSLKIGVQKYKINRCSHCYRGQTDAKLP